MEKISWTDNVRNEEILHKANEERNILHTIKIREVNWIVQTMRKKCLLKHTVHIELQGGLKVTGRQARRRKQLLDDLEKRTGYWKLKQDVPDRTVWRTRFGRSYRKTDYETNKYTHVCDVNSTQHSNEIQIGKKSFENVSLETTNQNESHKGLRANQMRELLASTQRRTFYFPS
jgi:hypothetical protein